MMRLHNFLLGIIVILSLVIGASTLTRGHDWGDDFAWYIVQTKSLLNGTTAEMMQHSEFTNTQSTTHVGPLAYPWGFPLFLVPIYAIKGISPLGLKLPGLFFYVGFLICLYFLTRVRLTKTESLIIVSLFAFNPMLIQFENQILSDIPFLFFSTLTLLLMIQEKKHNLLQYILIGISIFFTAFMRATGVLLLGSLLIIEFFRFLQNIRDWDTIKQIILKPLVICSVFALLWIINIILLPSGGESYLSQYAGLTLDTVREFTVLYFNVFSRFFGETDGWKYLYFVLLVFFLFGAWIRRKDETIFIVFTILWLIVHITYPYWQGPRYIFPILPIFIYFTFLGIKAATAKLPDKYRTTGARLHHGFWILIIGIFLINSGITAIDNIQNERTVNGPFDSYSLEVYEFVNEETPGNSKVVFFKPRVMFMMTGRDTIMSMECDRILIGDYLVLNRKVGENQQIPPEKIGSCNLPIQQVLKNQRFIVYQIQK
ncbi:MAG TPA: hypothetical protein DCX53_04070 [Anaerolineae bacterium]|nr:hypothetical protein [Anaerolineae bacterium]